MNAYRPLTKSEIKLLEQNQCTASDWSLVLVSDNFSPDTIRYVSFSGQIRLGAFNKIFNFPGGVQKKRDFLMPPFTIAPLSPIHTLIRLKITSPIITLHLM